MVGESDPQYSTTVNLTSVAPILLEEPGSKFSTQLLFPETAKRSGEGGLRLRNQFKADGYFDNASDKAGTNSPLVTIVTVVYNGAAHIERTILSVLNQSYRNIEYIIIDGGSTDGTLNLIQKYDRAIDYWVSEPDGGISNAFSKGLKAATGKLIGFVNADDWYESDAVSAVLSGLSKQSADIIHGQLQYWSENTAAELVSGNHDLLDRDMTINHPTVFASLALYKRVGGFDSNFRCAMDYDWVRRARAQGAKFCYIEKPLSNMRLGGVSDVQWKSAIREVARIKARYSSNSLMPWFQYCLQLIRGLVRKVLERIGLKGIIAFYHARLSLVSKISPPKR